MNIRVVACRDVKHPPHAFPPVLAARLQLVAVGTAVDGEFIHCGGGGERGRQKMATHTQPKGPAPVGKFPPAVHDPTAPQRAPTADAPAPAAPLPQRTEATGERLGIARSTACSNTRIRRQRYGCHHRRRPPPNWLAASGVPHGGTNPIQASSAPGRLPDIPRSNAPRSAAVTAARTHRRPSSTVYVRSRRLRETAASSEQRGEGRCPPRDELPPSRHHRRRRHSRNGVEGAVIT